MINATDGGPQTGARDDASAFYIPQSGPVDTQNRGSSRISRPGPYAGRHCGTRSPSIDAQTRRKACPYARARGARAGSPWWTPLDALDQHDDVRGALLPGRQHRGMHATQTEPRRAAGEHPRAQRVALAHWVGREAPASDATQRWKRSSRRRAAAQYGTHSSPPCAVRVPRRHGSLASQQQRAGWHHVAARAERQRAPAPGCRSAANLRSPRDRLMPCTYASESCRHRVAGEPSTARFEAAVLDEGPGLARSQNRIPRATPARAAERVVELRPSTSCGVTPAISQSALAACAPGDSSSGSLK